MTSSPRPDPREAALAAALRANLKRRKASERSRIDASGPPLASTGDEAYMTPTNAAAPDPPEPVE